MENEMIKEKSWEEFRESGLLWFINQTLHLFGWAITYEFEDGKVTRVYPARVRFRGFSGELNDKGYQKVSKYLKENIEVLEKESLE